MSAEQEQQIMMWNKKMKNGKGFQESLQCVKSGECQLVILRQSCSKHVLETDEKLKNTEALKKSLEHLEIIKKDTISIFEKNNIKAIESINKKLDPNFHQAMIEIEDNTKEPGTIIQEIQKGFTIKDRLLRPSLVGVSKKTSKKEEKTEKNEENIKDK